MFEDISKKRKWSWNSGNSKHGDDIGVGGEKLERLGIDIELHGESPLPPECQQCLDLQVSFLIFFFIGYILCFSFIHGFLLSMNSRSGLFHSSSFFLIINCVSLLLMVYFVGH